MKPFEVTKGIFIVGGPEITDGRDRCVYLLNMGELILIDSGVGWSVDQIQGNIERLGFDCSKLSKLILTHCHIDHIGGASQFRKRFSLTVCIHKLDAPPLETGDPVLTAQPGTIPHFHRCLWMSNLICPRKLLPSVTKSSFVFTRLGTPLDQFPST